MTFIEYSVIMSDVIKSFDCNKKSKPMHIVRFSLLDAVSVAVLLFCDDDHLEHMVVRCLQVFCACLFVLILYVPVNNFSVMSGTLGNKVEI